MQMRGRGAGEQVSGREGKGGSEARGGYGLYYMDCVAVFSTGSFLPADTATNSKNITTEPTGRRPDTYNQEKRGNARGRVKFISWCWFLQALLPPPSPPRLKPLKILIFMIMRRGTGMGEERRLVLYMDTLVFDLQ